MWILILSFVASFSSSTTAISSVAGFNSEQACVRARDAWIRAVEPTPHKVKAVCVKA